MLQKQRGHGGLLSGLSCCRDASGRGGDQGFERNCLCIQRKSRDLTNACWGIVHTVASDGESSVCSQSIKNRLPQSKCCRPYTTLHLLRLAKRSSSALVCKVIYVDATQVHMRLCACTPSVQYRVSHDSRHLLPERNFIRIYYVEYRYVLLSFWQTTLYTTLFVRFYDLFRRVSPPVFFSIVEEGSQSRK